MVHVIRVAQRLLIALVAVSITLTATSTHASEQISNPNAEPPRAVVPAIGELTASQTVAAVSSVDPTNVTVADIEPTAAGYLATENGASIVISKDPAAGITMATDGGPTVEVTVPGATKAADAKVVGDTVVYEGVARGTDIAVQAVEGGAVRQIITIADHEAPKDYTFTVDVPEGAELKLRDDGGAQVVRGDEVITTVPAPWARDANGAPLETSYTISGRDQLTQHIRFDHNTAMPVTADPLWIAGFVLYVVGWKCGVGAAVTTLLYHLYTQNRSVRGYVGQAVLGCIGGGLGFKRLW